jgi:hypothetical protein
MGSNSLGAFGAFAGLFFLVAIVVGFILLFFLFWAPLKLYGIHKEAKFTNVLLQQILSRHDAQCNMLAAIAAKSNSSPPPPGLPRG